MSISKHKRKSGATTIKRDGKIVGNIGRGKTRVPTIQENPIQKLEMKGNETPKNFSIGESQKRFTVLSEEKISCEQAQTLWNLTVGQNLVERLNIFSNYIDRLNVDDRNEMITAIGSEYHTYNRYEYEPGSRADPLNLILRGKSLDGNINPNVLDAFAHYDLYGQTSWRNSLAQNINTTSETLDFLAADDDTGLLSNIIQNPHTRTHTITKIFDKIEDTRKSVDILCGIAIAQNQNTSRQILEKLVEHHERSVRIAATAALRLRTGRT